jgi:hypothetical protein
MVIYQLIPTLGIIFDAANKALCLGFFSLLKRDIKTMKIALVKHTHLMDF